MNTCAADPLHYIGRSLLNFLLTPELLAFQQNECQLSMLNDRASVDQLYINQVDLHNIAYIDLSCLFFCDVVKGDDCSISEHHSMWSL